MQATTTTTTKYMGEKMFLYKNSMQTTAMGVKDWRNYAKSLVKRYCYTQCAENVGMRFCNFVAFGIGKSIHPRNFSIDVDDEIYDVHISDGQFSR